MIPIFFFKVHNFLNRIKKEYRLQRQIQIDELLMFFVVLFCIKKHTSKHGSVINAMQTCTSGPGDLILYEKSTKIQFHCAQRNQTAWLIVNLSVQSLLLTYLTFSLQKNLSAFFKTGRVFHSTGQENEQN